ncbi:MAG: beta-ketoacyl-[acyl-carrier-protein] synthase family protein [Terriglobales bacterium]
MRRVVVSGLGMVCAMGRDREQAWKAMCEGTSAIRPIRSVDTAKLRFHMGAEAGDFDSAAHFPNGGRNLLDRFAQFGVVAARAALADAGFELTPALRGRTCVITGSCLGGQSSQDAGFFDLYERHLDRVHPLTILRTMANAGASHICIDLGLTGAAYTISTACASAAHAIGQAFWMVRSGMADAAITGGSEAPFSYGILKAWEAMRVIAPDTCRPFSRDRKGMILGEGGAMLVLEPLESARARGVQPYAEVIGFGMSSDAHHVTQPTVAGPASAMRAALQDGEIPPERIGYINAHGTGTAANDVTEVSAIREVFGDYAESLAISSTKSLHGHALGAAGALEAAATVLALRRGLLPPTANFTAADPDCDLDVIPNCARETRVDCALSNSFAFGGLNAVLAFRSLA